PSSKKRRSGNAHPVSRSILAEGMMSPNRLFLSIVVAIASLTNPHSAIADQGAIAQPETRRVFFGELHLHTAYSLDAWALIPGLRTTPDDAYRFARGE